MAPQMDFGIAKELELVEKRLKTSLESEVEYLTEIASYSVKSGGKRIRPMVTLLSFKAVNGTDVEKAVDVATAIELIHTGSLIHDDINDGGELRRGQISVPRRFGLMDSIIAGDFLFSKGFEIGGQTTYEIVRVTADACSSLAAGEILQRKFRCDISQTVERYLDLAERKTSRLIAAGAKAGALVGEGTEEQVKSLGEYGRTLGITFQIIDDILDVIGDEKKLGKRVGTDIKDGSITLLSIHALNDGSKSLRDELASILEKKEKTEEEILRSLQLIKESGAPEQAFQDASRFAQLARNQVSSFDDEHKERLMNFVDFILNRDS
ncbi:MAG: polyprenyl synthetase family protein [Methanomassiliicoccales archaeon]|nr:MAG: polyprenyl synthetase family protein [Methanomassiliicoccales archaeon]